MLSTREHYMKRKAIQLVLKVLVLIVTHLVTGCQAKLTIENEAVPLSVVDAGTATVSVTKISVDPKLGDRRIGTYHGGLARIPYKSYTVSELYGPCAQAQVELEIELRNAGYNVIGNDDLFRQGRDMLPAEYLIGGRIVTAAYNSYDSVAGLSSKAAITIQWQLFNNSSDAVVFTSEAHGKAKGPMGSPNTIVGAIKGSFRELLADPDFVSYLQEAK